MPYILSQNRQLLDCYIDGLNQRMLTEGELNYIVSSLVHRQIVDWHELSYAALNKFIGTLECIKLELYRAVAAKYEDKKRIENGGISELDAKTLEDVR